MRGLLGILGLAAALVGPAWAHDWYTDLRDGEGNRCCSVTDCLRAENCRIDGREGLSWAGACRPIDWSKVLPLPSPDGAAHVCWIPHPLPAQPPLVRCIVLPGSA